MINMLKNKAFYISRISCKCPVKHIATTQYFMNAESSNGENDSSDGTPDLTKPFIKKKNSFRDKTKNRMKKAKDVFVEFKGKEYNTHKLVSVNESRTYETDEQKGVHVSKDFNIAAEMEKIIEDLTTENTIEVKCTMPEEKRNRSRKEKNVKDAAKVVAQYIGVDIAEIEKELIDSLNVMKGDKHKTDVDSNYFPQKKRSNELCHNDIKKFSSLKGVRLNIFKKIELDKDEQPNLEKWEYLKQKSLNFLMVSPPKNYFDELIMWTKQGKLWHFPLDNEQGMDEEKSTDFTEHIFLDRYLEPWCPKTGPIRHFMELVTIGLSKNHLMSVETKKDHIMWYKNYFENKRKLLNELGVMEDIEEPSKET